MKILVTTKDGEIMIEDVVHIMWSRIDYEEPQIRIYTHTTTCYLNAEDVIDISVEEWR